MKVIVYSLVVLAFMSCEDSDTVNGERIKDHIAVLASDSLEGRGTGTRGEAAAAAYLTAEFQKLKLQPGAERDGFLQKFIFRQGPHGTGATDTASNVVAYLDNGSNTTIVIGAHYDHLGNSGQPGSLDPEPGNKIHNGADDNASGVAGVIELARYFSTNHVREKNNFLFLCFSGEELGLLGSKYFTSHPSVNLDSVNFMINLDMIGRLNPKTRALTIHGTGTSDAWEPLIETLKTDSLVVQTDSSGTGPSDHSSFHLKNIPVLHFFTGTHPDYHKPGDDVEKINTEGIVQVLTLIIKIIESQDVKPKLKFLPTKDKNKGSPSFNVTLGIMPDYTSSQIGLAVDGVVEGRPADLAGIRRGDIIIKMDDSRISDIYDYMDVLQRLQKGQKVSVEVSRGEKIMKLDVQL